MKSSGSSYSYTSSHQRMKDILDSSEAKYEEVDSLPAREKLTFSNGYYAYCSAVFIDIRKSSSLPDKYKRPKLAKLYRAFISEVVAVMDGSPNCQEVNIVGDGAWAVLNTPYKADIDEAFRVAYFLSSAVDLLNYELDRHGYEPITVGIGASYGRALVIKAGFSGSSINDVVYMGDVVNAAAKLASYGNQNIWSDKEIMVSDVFYNNLKDDNKKFLSWNYSRNAWNGNVISIAMQEYLDGLA